MRAKSKIVNSISSQHFQLSDERHDELRTDNTSARSSARSEVSCAFPNGFRMRVNPKIVNSIISPHFQLSDDRRDELRTADTSARSSARSEVSYLYALS